MALFKSNTPAPSPATEYHPAPPPPPPPAYAAPPATTPLPPAAAPAADSVLGPNVCIKGDMTYEGSLRIEGKIEGKIVAQGRLTVAAGAQVIGEIAAGEAIIEGMVQGNVTATDRVELAATAQVVGDVRAQVFAAARGAKLLGSFDIDSESITKLAPAAIPTESHRPAKVPTKSTAKADPLASAL